MFFVWNFWMWSSIARSSEAHSFGYQQIACKCCLLHCCRPAQGMYCCTYIAKSVYPWSVKSIQMTAAPVLVHPRCTEHRFHYTCTHTCYRNLRQNSLHLGNTFVLHSGCEYQLTISFQNLHHLTHWHWKSHIFRLLFLIASNLYRSVLWHQYSALLPDVSVLKHDGFHWCKSVLSSSLIYKCTMFSATLFSSFFSFFFFFLARSKCQVNTSWEFHLIK